MSKPQVITVPALAGIGNNSPVQIPIGVDIITLINLSNTMGLTLCNDDRFVPSTTWPLYGGMSAPQPGVNNLWIQNPNNSEIDVLVLMGDSIPSYSPVALNSGGLSYVSATLIMGTFIDLLPAPPTGYAYRIHLVTTSTGYSTSQGEVLLGIEYGPYWFALAVDPNTSIDSTLILNGLLITNYVGGLYIGQTGTQQAIYIAYDIVKL